MLRLLDSSGQYRLGTPRIDSEDSKLLSRDLDIFSRGQNVVNQFTMPPHPDQPNFKGIQDSRVLGINAFMAIIPSFSRISIYFKYFHSSPGASYYYYFPFAEFEVSSNHLRDH